jgi:hypothetical protein
MNTNIFVTNVYFSFMICNPLIKFNNFTGFVQKEDDFMNSLFYTIFTQIMLHANC